jgi:transcriptional regulator with XRE-family HTH domain
VPEQSRISSRASAGLWGDRHSNGARSRPKSDHTNVQDASCEQKPTGGTLHEQVRPSDLDGRQEHERNGVGRELLKVIDAGTEMDEPVHHRQCGDQKDHRLSRLRGRPRLRPADTHWNRWLAAHIELWSSIRIGRLELVRCVWFSAGITYELRRQEDCSTHSTAVVTEPGFDILIYIINPGSIIRRRRQELLLSQRSLARRAGTTQAAVSRIESGLTSPNWETVRALLLAMGCEPDLSATPLRGRWDPVHLAAARARTPQERFELAISANRLAGRLRQAAAERDGG